MSETPVYAVTLEEVSRQIEAVQKSIDDQRKFRDEQKAMLKLTGRGDLERNKALKQHQTLWRGIKSDIKESYAVAMKLGRFGVGLGLTGAGLATAGYYGMNRMAHDSGNDRKESQGIAGTVGELNSAKLNFEKLFGNVKGTIDQLRDIRADDTKRPVYLSMLEHEAGITREQEDGMSNTELLSALLPTIKKIYDGSNKSQLGIEGYKQSIGLGSFSLEDLTRFGQMSQEEIAQTQERYKKGIPEFEQKDKDAREYQDFARQFDETMMGISSSFKRTLVDLSPKLRELTDVTGDAVKRIVESKDAYKLITKAADGLEKAVKYLSSPEATMDFEAFMTEVKDAGRFLHYLTHPGEAAAAGWDAAKQDFSYGVDHAGEMASEMWQKAKDHVTGAKDAIAASNVKTLIDTDKSEKGLIRAAILGHETNMIPDAQKAGAVSKTGAMGHYQVTGGNIHRHFPSTKDKNSPDYLPDLKDSSQISPEEKEFRSNWAKKNPDKIQLVGEKMLDEAYKYAGHSAKKAAQIYNMGLPKWLTGSISKEAANEGADVENRVKELKNQLASASTKYSFDGEERPAQEIKEAKQQDKGVLDKIKEALHYSPDKSYEQFMAERKQQEEERIAKRQTPETKQQTQQARAQESPGLIPQASGYAAQRQRVDVQVQSVVRVVQNPGADFTSNALGIMQ